MIEISVLIPTRERYDLLSRCLTSLSEATKGCSSDIEVVVLDGSESLDTTIKVVKQYSKNICRVVEVEKWWNYAQINNYGSAFATGKYFLLLNNDCYVDSEFFVLLRERLTSIHLTSQTIQGFLLLYPNRTINHAGVRLVHRGPNHIGLGLRVDWYKPSLKVFPLPAVTFACALIPRDLYLDIKMEEKYIFGYEDIDFCLQAWEKGYHVVMNTDIIATHLGNASSAFMSAMYPGWGPSNLNFFMSRWKDSRLSPIFNKINEVTLQDGDQGA